MDAVEHAVRHIEGLTCSWQAALRPLSSSSHASRVPGTGVVYRLTLTDDFTLWRWLNLLTNKREETILEAFKE